MFARNLKINKISKKFSLSAYKTFAKHSSIIIIGAGTGGVSLAKQLNKQKDKLNINNITIFDPSKIHHYQPGWTQIGGIPGIINSVSKTVFDTSSLLKDKGIEFQNVAVKELDPDNNLIKDANGEEWKYDQLIVACGIKIIHNSIPGNDYLKFKIVFFKCFFFFYFFDIILCYILFD